MREFIRTKNAPLPSRRTSPGVGRGFREEEREAWEEAEEVESYEEVRGDMDGLGWNEIWRRGDAVGDGRSGASGTGSGLDEGLLSLAEMVSGLGRVYQRASGGTATQI